MATDISLEDSNTLPLPLPTGGTWNRSSRAQQTQAVRKALAFQRRLEHAVHDAALLSCSSSTAQADELDRLSTELTATSQGLHEFFSDFACTALHIEKRVDGSCPARRAFVVEEVLACVLGFLDTIDLLQVQQVDRTIRQAIDSSLVLQEKLRLRPSWSGHWDNPFLSSPHHLSERSLDRGSPHPGPGFPGFTCRIFTAGRTGFAGVYAEFSHDLPRLGKRCRSIQVCQPPIRAMGAYPTCCMDNPYGLTTGEGREPQPSRRIHAAHAPFTFITSDEGITVGDLYDLAIQKRELHENCAWAPSYEHTDEGEIFASVTFGGSLKLQPDDPAVTINSVAYVPERNYDPFPTTRPVGLLHRYVAAKRRGEHHLGKRAPSFQEFKDGIDPVTGLYPGEDDSTFSHHNDRSTDFAHSDHSTYFAHSGHSTYDHSTFFQHSDDHSPHSHHGDHSGLSYDSDHSTQFYHSNHSTHSHHSDHSAHSHDSDHSTHSHDSDHSKLSYDSELSFQTPGARRLLNTYEHA